MVDPVIGKVIEVNPDNPRLATVEVDAEGLANLLSHPNTRKMFIDALVRQGVDVYMMEEIG